MAQIVEDIEIAFSPVIGLKLSAARNAGSMKVFHFGHLRPHPKGGTMGSYALHIQCPWRLTTPQKSVPGSSDYWYPADPDLEDKGWKPDAIEPSLQEKRILAVLLGYDPDTKSCVNITDLLVVESVKADAFGGVELRMSGGYCLQIFPVTTDEDRDAEDWRFFELHGVHFVLRPNGRFERQEDAQTDETDTGEGEIG